MSISGRYTTIEAAQRLGVSVQTIQRWVDMGQLRAWKTLGGHRRIESASVETMLAERTVSRTTSPPLNGLVRRHGEHATASPTGTAELLPPMTRAAASAIALGPDAAPRPTRVLVVDDHPADLELLLMLVARALPGAQVTGVSSGFEALLAIGRETPDALITDLLMPHMNGLQMLAHLADTGAIGGAGGPGLIVATSSHTPEDLALGERLPEGVHFVAKPIHPEQFAQLLRLNLRNGGCALQRATPNG